MNYIGSKNKLSPWIEQCIVQHYPKKLENAIFCDLFAGTGIIGRRLKTKVASVIANDTEYYSYVLLKNYIQNFSKIEKAYEFIEKLNALDGTSGFIAEEYGQNGRAGRQFFSQFNAEKIDACRQQIRKWKESGKIGQALYYFLLASLLESADKVANTASVYGAYLKKVKASAKKTLLIEPAEFEHTRDVHQVYQKKANTLIREVKGDILYLDPPYNTRQYGANYHLLNTIAHYKAFEPKGKTGLPNYYKSLYCKKKTVLPQLEDLIENANFDYIFMSYNNEGLMHTEEIKQVFERFGSYELVTRNYQRFKADSNRVQKSNYSIEQLHILKR